MRLGLAASLFALADPRVALLRQVRALLDERHQGDGWPDHSAHVAWYRFAQVTRQVSR